MWVRILGGGVAGLASAVALRHRGVDDVVILERDTPAEQRARPGHGMILMPNGVAALRALSRAVFQNERGHAVEHGRRCTSVVFDPPSAS